MRYLLALLLPPLAVLSCGKPIQTIISIPLTILFWVPGVVHALFVVSSYQADQRNRELISAIKGESVSKRVPGYFLPIAVVVFALVIISAVASRSKPRVDVAHMTPALVPIPTAPHSPTPEAAEIEALLSPPPVPAVASSGSPTVPASKSPGVGDLAALYIPGNTLLYMAVREDAWDEMLDAENKADAAWIQEMVAAGKVAPLPNGIRVRVMKLSFASRLVRVQEGPDKGTEGWIQVEQVKSPDGVPAANLAMYGEQRAVPEPSEVDVMEHNRVVAERRQVKAHRESQPSDDARARTLLRMAQGLEKNGKADKALANYQELVEKYPGSAQAKEAAERIRALELRPKPAGPG